MSRRINCRQESSDTGDQRGRPHTTLALDYHQRTFLLLHEDLKRSGYRTSRPHPIRKRFWQLVPRGKYNGIEARGLVLSYLRSLEDNLSVAFGNQSVAYCLHLYRRIAPHAAGSTKRPPEIGEVRKTLEAGFQKFGQFQPCNRVGISNQIPMSSVLGGLLMSANFNLEREALSKSDQLVLTEFGTTELREFYDMERLAYEIWRSAAMLRSIGKGASIIVEESKEYVAEIRTRELNELLSRFDARLGCWADLSASATGVVFPNSLSQSESVGIIFLPIYNLGRIKASELERFFDDLFHIKLVFPGEFNFFWGPFSLREYRTAHLPFAEAFEQRNGVPLDAVLLVIAALSYRVFYLWNETKGSAAIRYWQRAYEGPLTREYILNEIRTFLPAAAKILDIQVSQANQYNLVDTVAFLELKQSCRDEIDLAYPGPHYIFLPFGRDRQFIDYAWIIPRLYLLFFGVTIPDQNFKGEALEKIVRYKKSVLPTGPCISNKEERKQIDAAFRVGDRLVIVECKAIGRAIGFDRGDPESISYRERIVNKALDDVDQKAQWLASNPVGRNYDISSFRDILPIAVTPFIEYIPSLHSHYWLTQELPRICTPHEFKEAISTKKLGEICSNIVKLKVV